MLADVRELVARTILTIIMICSNAFLVILLVILLILVDPITAVTAFLFFGLIYTTLYFFVKGILDNIGTDRLAANTSRFKAATEIFALIKEMKISGKESFYLSAFGDATKKFVSKEVIMMSISALPKFFIEMVIFTVLISVVLVNLSNDVALNSILPVMALYAFAVYRLVPALQIIFANISLFRASASVLGFVSDKYDQLNVSATFDNSTNRLNLHKDITFRDISFRYPEAEKEALSKISLQIPAQ